MLHGLVWRGSDSRRSAQTDRDPIIRQIGETDMPCMTMRCTDVLYEEQLPPWIGDWSFTLFIECFDNE